MTRQLRMEYPGAMYHVMNCGHQREDIFQDDEDRQRYKALVVEGGGNGYLRTVCDYVHLTPARAGLLKTDVPLDSFGWSSYGQYLKPSDQRLGWPEDELRGRPKGHSGTVMMARRRRQETTMSLKGIAQRLQMGTWTYVSNLLNEKPESPAAQEVLPLCQ